MKVLRVKRAAMVVSGGASIKDAIKEALCYAIEHEVSVQFVFSGETYVIEGKNHIDQYLYKDEAQK